MTKNVYHQNSMGMISYWCSIPYKKISFDKSNFLLIPKGIKMTEVTTKSQLYTEDLWEWINGYSVNKVWNVCAPLSSV
jgi:hypothetical protein